MGKKSDELEGIIVDLEVKIADLETHIKHMNCDINAKNKLIEDLNNEYNSTRSFAIDLKNENTKLKDDNAILKSGIEYHVQKNEDEMNLLKTADSTLAAIKLLCEAYEN
jgi:chromosome segregation ATPase